MAKPCRGCGGPKGEGKGRRMCDACRTSRPCGCGNIMTTPAELRRSACNACHSAAQRVRNAESAEDYYRAKSLRRYGLTEDELEELLRRTVCDVCGSYPEEKAGPGSRLNIDHCHQTGRVRGMLCAACNRALGQVRDDPDILRALAAYVELNRN